HARRLGRRRRSRPRGFHPERRVVLRPPRRPRRLPERPRATLSGARVRQRQLEHGHPDGGLSRATGAVRDGSPAALPGGTGRADRSPEAGASVIGATPAGALARTLSRRLPVETLAGARGLTAGAIAVGEDVTEEELRLAGRPPVEVVRDAVIEVEAAGIEHGVDAVEEGGVVRGAYVLDHADGGDLIVAGAGGDVAEVAVVHPASSR